MQTELLSLSSQYLIYYCIISIVILMIAALVYLAVINKSTALALSILVEILKAIGYREGDTGEELLIQCPACGAINGTYSIFCEECDTALFAFAELETDNLPDQTKNTQKVAISGDPLESILGAWSMVPEQLQKNPDPNAIPGTVMIAHVIFDKYDSPEVVKLLAAFDALLSAVGKSEPAKHKNEGLSIELINHAMEKILGSRCTSDLFYENGSIGFKSGVILQDTEKARELIEEAFKDNGSDGVNHLISYFEPTAEKNVQPETASEQQTAVSPITISEFDKALNIVVTNNPDSPTTILEVTDDILRETKHDLSSEAIALRLKCKYIKTAILNKKAEISDQTADSKLDKESLLNVIQEFRFELINLIHDSKGDNTTVKNRAYEMLLQIAEDTSDEADAFREDIAVLLNIEVQK